MKTRCFLGLDVASFTGWCVLDAEGGAAFGSVDLDSMLKSAGKGKPADRHAEKLAYLHRAVTGVCADHRPDAAMVEGGFSRGAGTAILAKLAGVAQGACYLAGVPVLSMNAKAVRKLVLGDGNADKDVVFAACVAAGHLPSNTDESDAWLLAEALRQKARFR